MERSMAYFRVPAQQFLEDLRKTTINLSEHLVL
jgi:hypothetical protein